MKMGEKKSIRLSDLDPKFKYEVFQNPDGKNLFYCFQCGTCTATCDVAELMDIVPHKLIRMAILGMRERVLNSKALWVCTTCFLCSEKCPQKVDPSQAFFAMKNIAAKEIGIPKDLKAFVELIYTIGRSAMVEDIDEEDRDLLDIPEVPNTNVAGVRNAIDATSLGTLIRKSGEK
jgi:heterodisulfide reductase subunit C